MLFSRVSDWLFQNIYKLITSFLFFSKTTIKCCHMFNKHFIIVIGCIWLWHHNHQCLITVLITLDCLLRLVGYLCPYGNLVTGLSLFMKPFWETVLLMCLCYSETSTKSDGAVFIFNDKLLQWDFFSCFKQQYQRQTQTRANIKSEVSLSYIHGSSKTARTSTLWHITHRAGL